MNNKKLRAKKGFTIVELVIVIAVIAILAAVLIPTFTGVVQRANESAALQEANSTYRLFMADAALAEDYDGNAVVTNGEYTFYVSGGEFTSTEPTEWAVPAEGTAPKARPDAYTYELGEITIAVDYEVTLDPLSDFVDTTPAEDVTGE